MTVHADATPSFEGAIQRYLPGLSNQDTALLDEFATAFNPLKDFKVPEEILDAALLRPRDTADKLQNGSYPPASRRATEAALRISKSGIIWRVTASSQQVAPVQPTGDMAEQLRHSRTFSERRARYNLRPQEPQLHKAMQSSLLAEIIRYVVSRPDTVQQ